ncbi:MAG: gliding motility-associated C-terminal domain-containing protein [Chitinophagaceae bacterium]
MQRIVLLFLILSKALSGYSQTDTAFWFAAPDVSSGFNYDRPIIFRITTYQQPAIVKISQPGGGGMPVQTISIGPNTTQSADLTTWINNIECGPGNVIQNKGIKITADNKIAVYYEVNAGGPNPELFALKGRNAIGTEFYISSQNILNNVSLITPLPFSSFNIVATEDNTNVTITPAKNIVGHTAGIAFSITLNKGQTYAAIATSQAAAQHLHGSHVVANKPVAVTLADDLLQGTPFSGPCEDLAGDQTVPVNIIGTEYIAIKSTLNAPFDKLYITATQDGTTVSQDGTLVTTLNTGASTELTVSNSSTYIQTSAPVYVYHLSGVGCEVGSAILPKIGCTGSSRVSIARSTNESFIVSLLVQNGGQNNFLVNNVAGVITAAQFAVVPATSGQWYAARVTLPIGSYPNGSIITVTNTSHIFQLGVMQGGILSGASVGYFSDYNSIRATASTSTPSLCEGAAIQLSAETVISGTYSWTGPNGFISNSQNVTINNATPVNSGSYVLTLIVPGCGTYTDMVNVIVKPKTVSTVNQAICEGQTYAGYTISGTYVDVFTGSNGCDSTRTLNLTVKPKTSSSLSAAICDGQNYLGYTSSGIYTDILIGSNGCDSTRTLNLTVIPAKTTSVNAAICEGNFYFAGGANQSSPGIYKDTLVAQSGCDSIITTTLSVNLKPSPDLGQDKNICGTIAIILDPGAFPSYSWQDMSTFPTFSVNGPGKYWVTVTNNNNCSNTDTIVIKNTALAPSDFLRPIDSLCLYEKMTIFPLNSYPSYLWSTGSIQPYITIADPGEYRLIVKDKNGCTGSDTILIFQKTCPTGVYVPTAFTPNGDQINNIFRATVYGAAKYFRLEVYNRNGELVFLTTDPLKGWNGIIKGVPQGSAVFVWQCFYHLEGGKPGFKKGTVTLIR